MQSCNTSKCFVSIPLIRDCFDARSRCTAYDRCSPLVVHIVISDRDEPSFEPNGWFFPPPSVPKIYRSRETSRASYRLSQRDVTRPTVEPQPVDRFYRFVSTSKLVPLSCLSLRGFRCLHSPRDLLFKQTYENAVFFATIDWILAVGKRQ